MLCQLCNYLKNITLCNCLPEMTSQNKIKIVRNVEAAFNSSLIQHLKLCTSVLEKPVLMHPCRTGNQNDKMPTLQIKGDFSFGISGINESLDIPGLPASVCKFNLRI